MVTDGLFEHRRYSERPPRDEDVLIVCGRDYRPILQALGAWGRRYFGERELSQLVGAESGRGNRSCRGGSDQRPAD
ncbi:winged helix-turn-helix transcriptional regulator [Sphingomonas sp. UYAg733]